MASLAILTDCDPFSTYDWSELVKQYELISDVLSGDGDEVRSVRSAPQGPSRRSWNHQMAGFILSLLHSEPPNELALFLAKPSDPERKQLSINGVKLNQLQGHIATDDIGAWIAVSDDGVRRTT
ncbi:hypothetical protein Bca101_062583 [Brassica carinata]